MEWILNVSINSKGFCFVCVCLSVCPAFTAYISLTVGWILIKLSENVGTLVRLIVLKFHKNRVTVDVIPIFKDISKGSNSGQREHLCAKGNNYAAPDCDTNDSNLLVLRS